MHFLVLKSGPDGISGDHWSYRTIAEALREVVHHRGWDSLGDLHEEIRRWAGGANPGWVFRTKDAVVVAVGVGTSDRQKDLCPNCGCTGMGYGAPREVEPDKIEQVVTCPHCSRRWRDIFVLAEQRVLYQGV